MFFSIREFKKRPYGLFLFLILTSFTQAQKLADPIVSKIVIEGNNKTKDFIIYRELRHPLYESIDTVEIYDDKNRLINLGIFSDVSWTKVPLEDGTVILKYIVQESIQKTPPTVFPSYKDRTGWSLNALWIFNNLRGRNQLLALSGSLGGENTYGLSFRDPWLFNDHISFSMDIMRNFYRNRFLNYDIKLNSLKIGFGKWYSDQIKADMSLASDSKLFTNTKENPLYKYLSLYLNIIYDSRDIYWNPGEGILFSNSFKYLNGYDSKKFQTLIWNQSLSYYMVLNKSQKKAVLALNGRVKKKFGYRDKFFQDYVGSSNTVRGWLSPDSIAYQQEPFRFGHEYLHASIEYRFEIIPKYITSNGIESGLVLVLFTDTGFILRNSFSNYSESIIYGSGFGIRIPFPMIGSLRFDCGIGIKEGKFTSNSFHFGIGQKF